MRIAVIIFTVCLVQTSASFFDEFAKSMSSVRSSVGKLFSDASVNLKETFHCTMFAARQAFSSDTPIHDNYHKCQENKVVSIPLSPSRPVVIYITPDAQTPKVVSKTSPPTSTELNNLNSTPKPADNKTEDNDIIEKKIDSVESYLLVETRNLANMSLKLEREFEDLSKHVNKDFIKLQNEQKKLSIEKVMQQIDKLREEEQIHENNTDSEIRQVFDKLITKVDKNNTEIIDLKEEIKLALAELKQNKDKNAVEQELEKWKKEELKNFNDIKELLKEHEQKVTMKPDEISAKTNNPSATIATVITTEVTTVAPVAPTRKKRTKSKRKSTVKPSSDYDSLVSKDPKILNDALKLVGNSKKTAAIMAALLKKEKSADNVFDRPELLGTR